MKNNPRRLKLLEYHYLTFLFILNVKNEILTLSDFIKMISIEVRKLKATQNWYKAWKIIANVRNFFPKKLIIFGIIIYYFKML